MGFEKLLKVKKAFFEKVLKSLIQENGYHVHYSYTNEDYYLSGDEQVINQLQMVSKVLLTS
jgi:hypothetical protein